MFEAWTKSEAFRAAHSRAGENKPLYLDHPQFEGLRFARRWDAARLRWHDKKGSEAFQEGAALGSCQSPGLFQCLYQRPFSDTGCTDGGSALTGPLQHPPKTNHHGNNDLEGEGQ